MESRNQNRSTLKSKSFAGAFCLCVILMVTAFAHAQTTSFTYQGRFTDGGAAATGTYDMQFKLFDTASAGSQIGSTITNGAVLVNNGVFTVQLDYGAAAFSGADRYLEIGVRLAGDANPYTILAPRQQLTSAVYAIRAGSAATADTATTATTATTAANATQLGGVAANQFVQTTDSRLADARSPTPGSSWYIQDTNNQQAANFNISGNGTVGGSLSANVVNTAIQYNIGGNRALTLTGGGLYPNSNTLAGFGAGASTIVDQTAINGSRNSFFGARAGNANTSGYQNSFFGAEAGKSSTTGSNNSSFGYNAGANLTSGFANAFFGEDAGVNSTTGNANSFFGGGAGAGNKSGTANTFFGEAAGKSNIDGTFNTAIGSEADVLSGISNATAIGARAKVTQSNSLVLGDTNVSVGIGTFAPNAKFHISVNGGDIVMGHAGCSSGFTGIGFGASLSGCANYSMLGNGTDTMINRPTGGAIYFRENNSTQMSIAPGGAVAINNLSGGGSTHLCVNGSNQISTCGSSLRYKTNIQPFISGLSVLNRLRPITFDWKDGGMHDLGFGAEEIAAVEPLLVTRNDKGQVEGVKYDRITAVLVNAVKEQQEQIKQQQSQIQSLKRLVCQRHRRAAVCK